MWTGAGREARAVVRGGGWNHCGRDENIDLTLARIPLGDESTDCRISRFAWRRGAAGRRGCRGCGAGGRDAGAPGR
jgi:hypothetical protein